MDPRDTGGNLQLPKPRYDPGVAQAVPGHSAHNAPGRPGNGRSLGAAHSHMRAQDRGRCGRWGRGAYRQSACASSPCYLCITAALSASE
jgi:hypothetical protein